MKETNLTLDTLSAAPGERQAALLAVPIVGVSVDIPVYLINGSEPGPTLVVTAGIHGSEYPSVEAALRLAQSIDPKQIHGQLIVVPVANPVAFAARAIYITPPDGKNLNRQFPGDQQGTFSQALAYWLFEMVIRQADYYIDLHGGDMIEALVPFGSCAETGDVELDARADQMAQAFGIPYIVLPSGPSSGIGGATHIAAAQAGIPALLAEAGGQGILDEKSVTILSNGVQRVMADLAMIATTLPPSPAPQRLTTWSWLRAEQDGLYYPAVQVGQRVAKGDVVGQINDLFGNLLQTAITPQDGVVLFLVTSLSIRQGDPLLAIAA